MTSRIEGNALEKQYEQTKIVVLCCARSQQKMIGKFKRGSY